MDHIVYIALGTNIGDRRTNLQKALAGLTSGLNILRTSPIYETLPWGRSDQPSFLNMVIEATTSLSPLELLAFLKRLEVQMGRKPTVRWGPRLIDLDILFFDDLRLDTPELCIPHPHLHERAFVLVPLADLVPNLNHPILNVTIKELLENVDASGVKPYE